MKTLITVRKALKILLEISNDTGDGVGVSSLAKKLGYPKSVTQRLLTTLKEEGFIEQNCDDKKYKIGYRSFLVGDKYKFGERILKIAEPYILSMIGKLDHPCSWYIGVLDDTDVVFLNVYYAQKPIRIESAKQGDHRPAHTTALGKALLAQLPPDGLNSTLQRINFTPLTNNSIVNIDHLINDINTTKLRGYAIADEESLEGVTAVGVAIAPSRSYLFGISASIPTIINSKELMMTLVDAVRDTANDIEQTVREYYSN